jgi:hypothetical protein
MEKLEALRYKLRMMGIPIRGPANVFCDNECVVKSSTRPESTLKKKHIFIGYHKVRESQASGLVQVAWENGDTNLSDTLMKAVPPWTQAEEPSEMDTALRVLPKGIMLVW